MIIVQVGSADSSGTEAHQDLAILRCGGSGRFSILSSLAPLMTQAIIGGGRATGSGRSLSVRDEAGYARLSFVLGVSLLSRSMIWNPTSGIGPPPAFHETG